MHRDCRHGHLALFVVLLLAGLSARGQQCDDSVTTPLVERFDEWSTGAGVLPDCWHSICNLDDPERKPHIVGGEHYSGTGALQMNAGPNMSAYYFAIVTTPYVEEEVGALFVRLRAKGVGIGTHLEIGVCDTTSLFGNNFTAVETIEVGDQWDEYIVPLASYAGTGRYIAIRMHSGQQGGGNNYIYVDDFIVEHCGVSGLNGRWPTYNRVTLEWENYGPPERVDLEYGAPGFEPGEGTLVTDVRAPYRLRGLQPSTTYEVHLIPICQPTGAGEPYQQTWVNTLDDEPRGLTYCEGFEHSSGGTTPSGWRLLGGTSFGIGGFSVDAHTPKGGGHPRKISPVPMQTHSKKPWMGK